MAAAQTAEQAFAVFDTLCRGLGDAEPEIRHTLYALALRAGLHPLLTPFREDPLRPLSGEFISLDARLASIFEDVTRLPSASSVLRDILADDLWTLGEPPPTEDLEPGDVTLQIGSIGGALYLPAIGGALACRVQVYHASGHDPDRVGWDRPVAVRDVSPAIESSATNALTAALFFLESHGLLPRHRLPGVVYYDISGTDLADDLLLQVHGNSLDLPLLIAFVSALITEPISEHIGATGAVEPPIFGEPIRLSPVSHVAEKERAFQSAFGGKQTRFVAPTRPEDSHQEVTRAARFNEVLAQVFPDRFAAGSGQPENLLDSLGVNQTDSGASPAYLCARIEKENSGEISRLESEKWKQLVATAIQRRNGKVAQFMGGEETWATTLVAGFSTTNEALSTAEAALQSIRFFPGFAADSAAQGRGFLPCIGIHVQSLEIYGVAEAPQNARRHAVRIAEAANPGQVLLSEAAQAAFSRGDSSLASLTALGDHRLRDLAPPRPLWQAEFAMVNGRGTRIPPRQSSPPRSLDTFPNNLPIQLTSLFGRERDIDTLRRLIAGRGKSLRMICVTGGGGIGKTRVALEVGADASGAFPDGVWFVRIEGDIRTAEDVAILVTESLPFSVAMDPREASPTKTFLRAVIFALSSLRTLLILDGCDTSTVSSAVGEFTTALLSDLPLAAVLLTARSRLGVPVETAYPLAPLTLELQDASDGDSSASLTPALELFHARARLAAPHVGIGENSDRQLAIGICRQLQGIPLAIEIAAAHVADFPLTEIAFGLNRNPQDGRRLPVMQRLFEWAYSLLDPHDQALLSALSVFENGFDSDAALAMVESGMSQDESLRLLAERSLIIQRQDGKGRYDLHDLVKEFALRKLSLSGRETAAHEDHAHYFAAIAARYGADEPNAERERAGFDRLEQDLTNIRATVEFLQVHEPERVPQVVVDLANFLRYRGHLREWRFWPALALRLLPDETDRPTRLGALVHLCRAASFADSNALDDADRHIEIAYCSALILESWDIAAKALNLRGLLWSRAERWNEASLALREARDLYRRVRSAYGEVAALNNLGIIAARQSRNSEARGWFEEASHLARAIEDRRGLAIAVGNLGYLALEEDDLVRARQYYEVCLAAGRGLRDATRVAQGLINLGDVLNRQGKWDSGTPLIALAEAMFARQRNPSLAESVQYLSDAEAHYGLARLEDLRREFGRLSLPQLLQIDPNRYTPLKLRL